MRFNETIPFAARGIVHTAMGISNGILVAAYAGGEGLATWAVASAWGAVLLSILAAIVDAGAAPVAAARGRDDAPALSRLTGQAVMVGLLAGLLILVAGVSAILVIGPAEVAARSANNTVTPGTFLAAMLIGEAIGMAAGGVRAALLGHGLGGRSAVGGGACKALQLLLGWMLIPRIGLLGVLVAHSIAQSADAAIQVAQAWVFREDVRLREVVMGEVAAQVKFGLVSAGADATRNTLYALCVGEVEAACGVPGLVLHTALVKVSNLHFKALGGISRGAQAEIAEGLAAGRRVWDIVRPTVGVLLGWGAGFSLVYAAIPAASWEMLAPGVVMGDVRAAVGVLSLTMPLEVTAVLGGADLRATQNSRALAASELLGALTMTAAGVAALRLGLGVPGLWLAFAADAAVGSLVAARAARK